MLSLAPPHVSGTRTRPELRDWGVSPDPVLYDIFSLQDLDNFASSDFSYLERLPISKRKVLSNSPDPSSKRRKLYTAPLYDLLLKVGHSESLLMSPALNISPAAARLPVSRDVENQD